MPKTTSFESLRTELLAEPETRSEYDALANEFAVAQALVAARAKARLSQQQVAERMQTTQSAVARMESGKHLPSMSSIERYATAIGHPIRFEVRPDT